MASNGGFRGGRGGGGGRGGRGRGGGGGDFRGGRGGGRGAPRGGRGGSGFKKNAPPGQTTKKLFVGNLPETVRIGDLRTLFAKYGNIEECDIVRDFAFVHYQTEAEAKAAVQALHLQDFQGSNITVELSYSKVRHQPGMGEKNECYGCGEVGHWSKDCPKGSTQTQRQGGRGGRDRGGRGRGAERSSYRRDDDYSEDFTRDISLDGDDPPRSYSEQFFARKYGSRDPYAALRAERARYATLPSAGLEDRYSRRYDPYLRRLPAERETLAYAKDPYALAAERSAAYKDPYARPPPDYYSNKSLRESVDPYARERYLAPSTSRAAPPGRYAAP